MSSKKEEANYIQAKSMLNEIEMEQWNDKAWEKLKDTYLEGKITKESWDRYVQENKIVKEEPEPLRILSMKELKDYETPNYPWRVKDLLQDKKIIIFSGSSAVYKSWLCLNLGLSVSKGIKFLNNFKTEQGGVLFIDRENSIPELQNRVEMIVKGLKLEDNELPMYFLSEQSIRLDKFDDYSKLKDVIVENNIKLIIIDTYRRVIGFEENDAGAVSRFFTEGLKPLCEKTDCSFILIHHHKKGRADGDEKELLRGSSDLVNFVDGIIQINRKGNKIVVKQTKNRSGKELEPFELNIDTDEEEYFKFEYLGKKQDNSISAKIIELIGVWIKDQQIKEFETKDVRNLCLANGYKKQRLFEALDEMLRLGKINKKVRGKYEVLN